MDIRTAYDAGTPSWIDLTTSDAEAAKVFYTSLFGLTAHDMPMPTGGVYTMLKKGDHDVAALSKASPEQANIPPHWNTYITVDDVDAATAKATELGGSVHVPAFDVMNSGRMAVLQDPAGAFFCVWQASDHIGAGLVNTHGAFTWSELMTNDVDRCGSFYNGLFSWEPSVQKMPTGDYTSFMLGDKGMGGMMAITEQMGPVPPHWGVYFGAEDCDATVAKAVELGGKVVMPTTEFPGVGRGALLQDPQGAMFSIIQLNNWPGV